MAKVFFLVVGDYDFSDPKVPAVDLEKDLVAAYKKRTTTQQAPANP